MSTTLISSTPRRRLSRRRCAKSNPLWRLGRLATRLQQALSSPSPQHTRLDHTFDRLVGRFEAFRRDHDRHRIAAQHGWPAAAIRTRSGLLDRFIDLRAIVTDAHALQGGPDLRPDRAVTAWQILEELRSLEEFDDPQLDGQGGAIAVTTEPILLEEVPLGRFRIKLDLGRLRSGGIDASAFSVEALEPNPPHGDEAVTHPHVRDGSPCLGEATVPIQTALRQGRINDAFRLVERILQTYNPSSAFRRLGEWMHVMCENCGDEVSPESSILCSACEQTFCSHCDAICQGCHESFCQSCVETTSDGEHHVCSECAGHCGQCGAADLSSTLEDQDGLCRSCFEEQESQGDDDAEEAAPAAERTPDSSPVPSTAQPS